MVEFMGEHVVAGTGEHVTFSGTAEFVDGNVDWRVDAVMGNLTVKLFGRVFGVEHPAATEPEAILAARLSIDERLGQVEDEFDLDD